MRTLKYAILGLLIRENLSGYDISSRLSGALKEFWSANHSQIYPELRKLTEEGLVTFSIEISGNVLERKVYSVTASGKADFYEWLVREEPMVPTPKDVFRLRMFFCDEMPQEKRVALTRHELEQHRSRLAHLEIIRDTFDGVPDSSSPAFGDYLVLIGAILREEAACRWLEGCLALIEK